METLEIRINSNDEIIISIIKKTNLENDNLYLDIKNIFISHSTPNYKIKYYNEIKQFSFIEYQVYFNYNKINNNNLVELIPNYTNNKMILFYKSHGMKKKSQINKSYISPQPPLIFKKININSIMFGGEKIIDEDEEPLLINNIEEEDERISISSEIITNNNNSGGNSGNKKDNEKLSLFLFLNVSFSVLSTLQFGYNTGVISPTILDIKTLFNLDLNQKSILVSSVLFGAMGGSFGSGFFVDIIGRKKSILFNNLFYILGPLLCSVGENYVTLLLGRIITGIGVGIASSVVPLYITEISPPSFRGSLGLLRQSTVTLGIMLSSLVAYGLGVYVKVGWRYTFAIAALPSLLQFIFCYWFVETPRWLILKNRDKEAIEIMKKIEPSASIENIELQVRKIKQNILDQKGSSDSWLQLFQLQYVKIYIIGFGLNMLQQFVGINCVIYYSGIILEDAGFVQKTAVLISALVGIPQLIMLLISVWLIDRFGRKPLLLYGLVGMVIGLAVLGYPFYKNSDPTGKIDSVTKGWIAVAGMIFFKLMYSVGLGPIPAIVASEIFPSKIRGKAMAISQLLNWFANCIVNISYLHMVSSIGQAGTFWVFGGISFFTFFFVLFLVPETKGHPIEEILNIIKSKLFYI